MAAVAALAYAPSAAAKSLRTTRTQKILVTVPDISNPFFSQVIRGVEEAATAAGYSVLLGDTRHEPAREEQYGQMLRRREADGLIFLGHRLAAMNRSAAKLRSANWLEKKIPASAAIPQQLPTRDCCQGANPSMPMYGNSFGAQAPQTASCSTIIRKSRACAVILRSSPTLLCDGTLEWSRSL